LQGPQESRAQYIKPTAAYKQHAGHRTIRFWEGISTEDAAFRLTDSVFKSVNQKMHVGGIIFDLTKAFDFVNHEILLPKLHFYGVLGVSEHWFKSYLTNRRRKVEVKSPNLTQNIFTD